MNEARADRPASSRCSLPAEAPVSLAAARRRSPCAIPCWSLALPSAVEVFIFAPDGTLRGDHRGQTRGPAGGRRARARRALHAHHRFPEPRLGRPLGRSVRPAAPAKADPGSERLRPARWSRRRCRAAPRCDTGTDAAGRHDLRRRHARSCRAATSVGVVALTSAAGEIDDAGAGRTRTGPADVRHRDPRVDRPQPRARLDHRQPAVRPRRRGRDRARQERPQASAPAASASPT